MNRRSKMFGFILVVVLILLVTAASNQAFAQGGVWETKAAMPTASSIQAAGVIDGKLYVAGGAVFSPLTFLSTAEVYDPSTDTWSTLSPMPTARSGAASGVIDGELYVVGGSNDIPTCCPTLKTLEAFSPIIQIAIDIKPGSFPNSINLKSKGQSLSRS